MQEWLRDKLAIFPQESSARDRKQQQISKAEATSKMKSIRPCIGLATGPFLRVIADDKSR